jgi:large subunit ribosomal protein L3
MPGSIGNRTTPGRVFKGKRMSGHMGVDTITTQNLLIHSVDAENSLLLIKGAIPGPTGAIVFVRSAAKKAVSETTAKAGA